MRVSVCVNHGGGLFLHARANIAHPRADTQKNFMEGDTKSHTADCELFLRSRSRFTFHGEEDSRGHHPSFVDGHALVPAGLIGAHGGHLEREVAQHAHPGVQTGVVAVPQPGEVEADGADHVAREDGAGAGGHRHVPPDRDGRRGLWVGGRGEGGQTQSLLWGGSKP